ncbi:restriction endonuclease subunit S [Sulfuriferula sp.]|uniref:restriction endonuclease subunit S n=1 Tax=Sulfuriferula sp. TaxID=2025307 RepID=UPI00272FECCE|nr:restriction endonuclease subunit S [Sulfuriferula sp.]MDP2027373.1 restriction endonuclease subunit S [Sulfuriferula sp.]
MNKNQLLVGRVSPPGVTRQVVDAVAGVGLRCANPTYGTDFYRLSEIADVQGGFAFKSADFGDEGIAIVKIANIQPPRVSLNGVDRVKPENVNGLERFELHDGDVLMAMTGATVGKVGRFRWTERAYLNQRVARISAKKDRQFDDFVYAILSLSGFDKLIEGSSAGSAQANISASSIGSVLIPRLPEDDQLHVGKFARLIDDRIALLRETNATLEAIAQALFKSWFVDFDPVHAKQQGRAPEGLDEATAARFPDSFEESELGLVPRGWRVGTLGSLAVLNPESWTAKKHPATVAYIDLANAKDNEIAAVTDYPFDEAPSRARRVLRDGDTIVGTVRPGNRSFAFIHEPAENLTASTGFAVLRPTMIQNTEFVYLAATQDSSIEHLAHVADGGAYPAVRPDVVAGIKCVLPGDAIMKVFHDVTAPLLASVAENQYQAQTLATLRDTLLPRLISGQLRLPEAETLLQDA